MNNLAIVLKKKRDDEARLARTSPQSSFNDDGTDQSWGGGSSYTLPQATETTLGGIKAKAKTTESGEVAIDGATGKLYAPSGGGSYTLPQATGSTLGGIIAAEKTSGETQEVKIDPATGKLYSTPPGAAANGVAAGGTTGQVYAKIDGTDYNAQWIDAPSGGGASYVKYDPDEPPASPSTYDDEFNDASIDAKWSWANQDTATAAEGGIVGKISITPAGNAYLRCLTQPVPSGAWEVTAKVYFGGDFISDSWCGLVVMPEADGAIQCLEIGKDGSESPIKARQEKWNSWTSFSSDTSRSYGSTHAYLKVIYDGTNLTSCVSSDGVSYAKLANSYAPGFTPGRFGISARGNALPSYFDWFRVVAL